MWLCFNHNLKCLCFQLGGRIPVLGNLSELVLRAEGIPVRLDPLSRLEALVCDIQTWKESAGKTFLLKNSPFCLLEVSLQSITHLLKQAWKINFAYVLMLSGALSKM